MSQFTLATCAVLLIVGLHLVQGASQGDREFSNVCSNCVVSNGLGYAVDPTNCNCYYTCVLVKSNKLSSMASDWESTKRCCPCGMSWSSKLLTCIDYKDKRSDCYNPDRQGANQCDGANDGETVPQLNSDVHTSPLCTGYIRCKEFSLPGGATIAVPETNCCPADQCYTRQDDVPCSVGVCASSGFCSARGAKEDCKKPTTAPPSECQYTSVPNAVTKFMGKENMITFTCSPGTCWDEDLCACVATNNTAYNDCDRPFLDMDFENDKLNVKDGSGNYIWAEATQSLQYVGNEAIFDGNRKKLIVVGGLANTYLSKTFVARVDLTLRNSSSVVTATEECVFGNCVTTTASQVDTVSVVVNRDNTRKATSFDVTVTYQDKTFMLGNGMATKELTVSGDFQVDTAYILWLIFCGKTEKVTAGVIDGSGLKVGVPATDDITDVKQLLMGQSGFVFGSCVSATDPLDADMLSVKFWRECKPWGDTAFEEAYKELITNA